MKTVNLKNELKEIANPKKAEILQRFFKTKKGEYGYGDIFLGITVPEQRKLSKKYKELSLLETIKLLQSKEHEYRLSALFILIEKYKKADEKLKENIVKTYLDNLAYINNWDLVDLSAPNILGDFLLKKDKKIIKKMAKSENIWRRRIAIISTLTFIRNNNSKITFEIAEILLNDDHDLIHKATGWMLREAGKKNKKLLKNFLELNASKMPRTMLRYSIERLTEKERKKFLNKKYMNEDNDKKYIKRCIKLSAEALKKGDNPFGSIIVKNNKIIAEAKNKIKEHDVTQHAEIVAMRRAQKILKTDDLSDCVIYSNCEPCPMCSFMIRELKFKKVVFSLESPYMGGFSKWKILQDKGILKFKPIFSDPPKVIKGVLKKEAKDVFKRAGWTIDEGFIK